MKRRNAFTLIEVLVVVAIIGLLVSILIPSLSRARDQARSAKCLANMRDMMTGVNTFAAGHRNRFQLVCNENGRSDEDPSRSIYAYSTEPSQPAPELMVWPAVLLKEAGVRSIRKNSDWGIRGQAQAAANAANIRQFETMSCPGDKIRFNTPLYPIDYYGLLSYGVNEDVTGARTDVSLGVWKDGKGNAAKRLAGRLDSVIRPSEVLMFSDAGSGVPIPNQKDALCLILSKDTTGPLLEHFEQTWGRFDDTIEQQPFQRHLYGSKRGAINLTYVDGHGGFARRFDQKPLDPAAPKFAYKPKVRVSPYNPGVYKK